MGLNNNISKQYDVNLKNLDYNNLLLGLSPSNLSDFNINNISFGNILDFYFSGTEYFVATNLLIDKKSLSSIILVFDLNANVIGSKIIKDFRGFNNNSYFEVVDNNDTSKLVIGPLSDILKDNIFNTIN